MLHHLSCTQVGVSGLGRVATLPKEQFIEPDRTFENCRKVCAVGEQQARSGAAKQVDGFATEPVDADY